MHEVLEKIGQSGIVPVIRIDDVETAVPLAKALVAGGIPCAEVTFRTAEGEEAIRRISAEVPDILVGAGTVLTVEQVDKAVAAGAKFAVSPGFNPVVVERCQQKGLPVTPGCSTPSDMEKALAFGLEVVKFFPAEQAGGLAYIKAVAAPYTTLKFMPTGGISAANLNAYLAFDKVLACGGSWMVKPELLKAGDFAAVSRLCRTAVQTMLGFELGHVGLNLSSEAKALDAASRLEALFGFAAQNGGSSVFAGKAVEAMKAPFLGAHGHIAVAANSVARAKRYLGAMGVAFREDTLRRDAAGKMLSVYLQEEIGGFAVHLVQKTS
jgi:2-dehydro-3-deoxyphosphogluconate aldolase/(4S)-4-hydroxy-2-oxoglutarate aldolase